MTEDNLHGDLNLERDNFEVVQNEASPARWCHLPAWESCPCLMIREKDVAYRFVQVVLHW